LQHQYLALGVCFLIVSDHELNVQRDQVSQGVLGAQHGVVKLTEHFNHLHGVGWSHQRPRAFVAQRVQLHVYRGLFTVQKQSDTFRRGVFVVIGHSVLSTREPENGRLDPYNVHCPIRSHNLRVHNESVLDFMSRNIVRDAHAVH
jgi:hypothetical protein